MGAFNANFQAQLDARQNEPCFCFALATASGMDGAWAYYSGVVPSGATGAANWKPYLRERISVGGQTLDPKVGTISVGSLAVEILSTSDHFLLHAVATEIAGGGNVLRPTVGLWMGYRSLAFADWVRVWVGKLRDVRLDADGTFWKVICNSLLDELRNDCMTAANADELLVNEGLDSWAASGAPNNWGRTVAGTSTVTEENDETLTRLGDGSAAKFTFDGSGNSAELKASRLNFTASTYYSFEFWARGDALALPFQIGVKNATTGNWLTAAAGTTPTATGTWGAGPAYLTATPGNGVYARTLVRFKTEATASPTLEFYARGSNAALASHVVYVDDASVSAKVIGRGNPLNLAVNLIGVPATVDAEFPVAWLAGDPSGVGLSVTMSAASTDQVAGYTIKTERDTFYAAQTVETTFTEPAPAIGLLEDDFVRMWGYLYQDLKAQIAFRGWHASIPPSSPDTWDDDVLTATPGWTRRTDLRLNRITVKGDWDAAGNEYLTTLATTEDAAAIAADGLAEMMIESRWMRTEHDGANLAAAVAGRLRQRTFRAPEELRCKTLFNRIDVGVGEEVQITNANLPNLTTGARGKVTELYEVIGVDADYAEAEASATLLRSYYTRPAFIAPNGTPVYASATAAQKQLSFISDDADQKMADDTAGYVVQ